MGPHGRQPRAAPASSAFGFGGTNFHIVRGGVHRRVTWRPPAPRSRPGRPSSSSGEAPHAGRCWSSVSACSPSSKRGAKPRLADLPHRRRPAGGRARSGRADAGDRRRPRSTTCREARTAGPILAARQPERCSTPGGIHFAEDYPARRGRQVAFLFPGQGSQYVNMGRDVARSFPVARASLRQADASSRSAGPAAEPVRLPAAGVRRRRGAPAAGQA